MEKIKCNSILYRQGYIEVENIHENCVNLETWQICSEFNINKLNLTDESLPEFAVVSNVELELDKMQVEALIVQLQNALKAL